MDQGKKPTSYWENPSAYTMLEDMISPVPDQRRAALEEMGSLEGTQEQPLVVYLMATRLFDPDLEVRFQAVKSLGKMLDFDLPSRQISERSLGVLTEFTAHLGKGQYINLLEVSAHYLAAEEPILNILKLCSYAGKVLGGILNDRKLPFEIRQQAIYFCGEVGFLTASAALRNLVQRIEKDRERMEIEGARKRYHDQERLYPFAVAALGKLEG